MQMNNAEALLVCKGFPMLLAKALKCLLSLNLCVCVSE